MATIKTHPVQFYDAISREWVANQDETLDWTQWVEIPGQPLPSVVPSGPVDAGPEDDCTWTWNTDLTPEEEARFDAIVKRVTGGSGPGPSAAEVEAAIDQVQLFITRSQDPTAQQTWDTIDAIAVILKDLHRKTL